MLMRLIAMLAVLVTSALAVPAGAGALTAGPARGLGAPPSSVAPAGPAPAVAGETVLARSFGGRSFGRRYSNPRGYGNGYNRPRNRRNHGFLRGLGFGLLAGWLFGHGLGGIPLFPILLLLLMFWFVRRAMRRPPEPRPRW
jgi:uncharacterized membrane protein